MLFSCSVMSDSLWPHGLQNTRLPCPSLSPWVFSNSCPLSQWCHPTISTSVVPFSFCLQFFPASGSFSMSQLLTSGGQSIGASTSASVLPMNIQGRFPLGLTGLILLPKGFSSLLQHQFKSISSSTQPSLCLRLSSKHTDLWTLCLACLNSAIWSNVFPTLKLDPFVSIFCYISSALNFIICFDFVFKT